MTSWNIAASDYPNLVPGTRTVNTVAAKTLLITYNWTPGSERYRRVARFVDQLFGRIDEFRRPNRHPKWNETNLTATFGLLPRFRPATEWLERNSRPATADTRTRDQFRQFLDQRRDATASMSNQERDRLFEEFSRWRSNQRP